MNQAIRNTWVVAIAMFTLLFGSMSVVQFFEADNLKDNDWNSRTLYQQFGGPRGAILVDGSPIAESVPSNDDFKFQRVYTHPELYSGLTGFYSLNYGATQLENKMNDYLAGQADSQFYDRLVQLASGAQLQGASVELTIDGGLQQLAYDTIPDGQQGTIIAMEPKTGNILAMASKPSYDTNKLAVHSSAQVQANMAQLQTVPGLSPNVTAATGRLIAPGSTFKLIDLVAALESGQYDTSTIIPNPAKLPLPGSTATLPNFYGGNCAARTEVDLAFALEQSCNTPFAQIALNLGQDAIRTTAENFGFNKSLQIPINVTASSFPSDLDQPALAQSSVGQRDVKATPLQMAMVAAAIANDGVQMKPNLIKAVRAPDLKLINAPKPEELRRSTSAAVANTATELMVGVVDKGIARRAAVSGVKVAGKTGTSEIGTTGKVNSWFTAFAPADDPQIVVTVVLENVDFSVGSAWTTPSAKKILEAVLNK